MACKGSPATPMAHRLLNRWSLLAVPLVLLGVCLAVHQFAGPNDAVAQQPRTSAFAPRPRKPAQVAANPGKQAAGPAAPAVAAVVNGEKISLDDLGRECL